MFIFAGSASMQAKAFIFHLLVLKFCRFFLIWCHPKKGVVQSFPNTYFLKKIVFTSKHNMEMTKSEKLSSKTKKKNLGGFFLIWRHPRKGMVRSSPNTYFQKRWFLLANTTWKWQKVKNYSKNRKKILGIFFDMTSSKKGRGSGFPNTNSQQFF